MWGFPRPWQMCMEDRLLVSWIRQLKKLKKNFFSLASSNSSAIKYRVITFASKCFQVFEWQPIKEAKYYSFGIHVLDVEEISYLLAHISTLDFEKKTKKNVFPIEFPTRRCYLYWNSSASKSEIFLCQGTPGVKIEALSGPFWKAGTDLIPQQPLTPLPPQAVSHLPPTLKE